MSYLTQDEAEYFDIVTSDDFESILNEHFGIILARVGSHPYWPARICEMEEWIDYLPHRSRKGQICVYFYGSHNYGWILRSNIQNFIDEEHPSIKTKKGTKMYIQYMEGIEEAKNAIKNFKKIYNDITFINRLKLKKNEVSNDIPCSVCNKKGIDEERIICDGNGCEREYHMSCLKPPLLGVPSGSWYCPICKLSCISNSKNSNDVSNTKRALNSSLVLEMPPLPIVEFSKSNEKRTRKETKSNDFDFPSEERCFLCGLGGELVVCEFLRCTKVYHQLCLGAYPFPLDDDTEWICPRHCCILTGKKETISMTSNTLWHCLQCPVALDDSVLSNIRALSKVNRKEKTILCPNCNAPSNKVQLAKILERIWSIIATNRQGMPFCGPLLVGVERPSDIESNPLDLFQIITSIRRLQYKSEHAFVQDVQEVMNTALKIVDGKSPPLSEAAKSLGIIVEEQVQYNLAQFRKLDEEECMEEDPNTSRETTPSGDNWTIAWRQECMPFGEKSYVNIDARTLEEWTIYVSNSTLYSNLIPTPHSTVDVEDVLLLQKPEPPVNGNDDSTPPLSLSEGIDVLCALSELGHQTQHTPSSTPSEPSIYREELSVTPSMSEMDIMFRQQGALLRKALTAHTTLEHAWNMSKQHMMGMQQNQLISVGEGRLAAELRIANNNLKARLRSKDQLVQELTSDHMEVTCELKRLQSQIDEQEKTIKLLQHNNIEPSDINSSPDTNTEQTPCEKRQRQENDTTTPLLKRGRGRPPKKKLNH